MSFDTAKFPLIQITPRQVGHSDADGFRHLPKIAGAGAGYVLSAPGGGGDPVWTPLSGVSVSSVFGRTGAVVANAGDYSAYYQPLSTKLTNFSALANAAGMLTNDGAGNLSWTTVAGVSVTSFNSRTGAVVPAAGDYDAYYWTKAQTTALVNTRSPRNRWPVDSSHGYAFTWAYDSAARRPTITPTGATFSVWLHGVEQVFTGAQALPVHANATGIYFYYLDTDGAFKVSTTPWNLLSQVPAVLVYYNASKGVGKAYAEFHTEELTGLDHESDHRTIGTKFVEGGAALSGYTIGTDSAAAVTFGIAACELYDEDLYHAISSLADGGPYEIWYQSGSSGTWTWDDAATLPYKVGATYITANQLVSTTWQQVQLDGSGGGQYVNMYVVPTPCKNGPQYIIMQGQGIFATQADAESESWKSLSLTAFPVQEFVPVWRVTFWARSSFTGVSGRVKIAAITTVATTRGGAAGGSNIHNSLSGRSDADCHPFTALTGSLASTQLPAFTGDATSTAGTSALTVSRINGTSLAGLGTGILKNTTGTGIPSIAVAGDFPTLNQSTTGNAATATKWANPIALTIGATGQNVDGSGPITFTLAAIGAAPATGGSYLPLAGGSMAAAAAVTFPGTYGGAILRDYTGSVPGGGWFAIYGSGVSGGPSGTNYSMAVKSDGTSTALNSSGTVDLQYGGATKLAITSSGANITGIFSASGLSTLAGGATIPGTATLSIGSAQIANNGSSAVALYGFNRTWAFGYGSGVALPGSSYSVSAAEGIYASTIITSGSLTAGGIVKAGAGTGTLALATSSNILAGISPDLWIGAPSGRGANSIGFGNLATGTGLWGWAFAQDADGSTLVNAPSGKTISFNIAGPQQGYVDYLGFHMGALTSTDVTSTNNTTSNSMINSLDRRAYSSLTATNASSPGYGPDILNITGPAHSLAAAASGSTYRQYRMPTAAGKSGAVIVLNMGVSGSVNAPYLLAYTGEFIREKDNGTVVGTDSSAYVRSGSITLISDGSGWWVC